MDFKVGDVIRSIVFSEEDADHIFTGKFDEDGAMICRRATDGHDQYCLPKDALRIRHASDVTREPSILDEAAKIAGVDRSEAYGHPLENHRRIALMWQAYFDARKPGPLTPQDAARMMILLKVARDIHAPRRDNRVDICGYAQCLELMEEPTK